MRRIGISRGWLGSVFWALDLGFWVLGELWVLGVHGGAAVVLPGLSAVSGITGCIITGSWARGSGVLRYM